MLPLPIRPVGQNYIGLWFNGADGMGEIVRTCLIALYGMDLNGNGLHSAGRGRNPVLCGLAFGPV